MRDELTRIEEQVRLAFEGGAWHGPAVLETLEGVTAETAAAHPIPGAHSIWEIVLHLAATYKLVLQRNAGRSGSLTPEQDWPAVASHDSKHWNEAVEELRRLNREMRSAILAFDQNRLDDSLAAAPYTAYVHFAGIPQHDTYHAGQISLLRKAQRAAASR
jgi:uncharacterized damage-inducible protein DinB